MSSCDQKNEIDPIDKHLIEFVDEENSRLLLALHTAWQDMGKRAAHTIQINMGEQVRKARHEVNKQFINNTYSDSLIHKMSEYRMIMDSIGAILDFKPSEQFINQGIKSTQDPIELLKAYSLYESELMQRISMEMGGYCIARYWTMNFNQDEYTKGEWVKGMANLHDLPLGYSIQYDSLVIEVNGKMVKVDYELKEEMKSAFFKFQTSEPGNYWIHVYGTMTYPENDIISTKLDGKFVVNE